MEYSKILLIRIPLYKCEFSQSYERFTTECSIALHEKSRVGQGQIEHYHKERIVLKKGLCEFYYLGVHKRLNTSRHHVHLLTNISNNLSWRFKAKSYIF